MIAAITEVRGEAGIWKVNPDELGNSVIAFAVRDSYAPPTIKRIDHVVMSEDDKAEVIKLTLERALNDKRLPDYGLLKNKKVIVLSTTNISQQLMPKTFAVRLLLLRPVQIQQKADREGDFLFLTFGGFRVEGERIVVFLTNTWARGKRSRMIYLSGGGRTMEYHRLDGKWIGEAVGGWIS